MKSRFAKVITFIDRVSMVLSILMLTGGEQFLKILAVFAYPTTLLFLFIYWKKAIWTLIQEKLFWLYLGLIILSIFWSANIGNTLYSTLKLIGTLLIGFSLAVRYQPKNQLEILAWAFGISAFLSFAYCLLIPHQGIMMEGDVQGSWRGIYNHKNTLARMMTISTMVFFLQAIEVSRYRLLFLFFCACSFVLVIFSQSKTSLVILLTLLAIFPVYRMLRWSYSWLIPFFSVTILTIGISTLLLVSNLETIVTALGRDITLTGRVPLWELVISEIYKRPWLGYGYQGFWLGWEGESKYIWKYIAWEPPHSHNGFLEILLAFGFIGLVVSTLTFISIFLRSLICIRTTKSAFGFWPLWYLTLLFLINITESQMSGFSIYWALSIAVAISTHRKILNQYIPIE